MKQFKINPGFLPKPVESHHDYAMYRDVRIPMRDGIELSANIFFPSVNGEVDFSKKYPVVLSRTPYFTLNGEMTPNPVHMHHYVNELGFVFVFCACRATNRSGGVEFWPMQTEEKDGVDTVKWIMEQSWCSGHIATCGGSYLGGTQYALQLAGDIPGLDTSVIHVPAMNSANNSWAYADDFFDMDCGPMWAISLAIDHLAYKHISPEGMKGIVEDNKRMGNIFSNGEALMSLKWPALQAEHGLANIPIIRNVPFYRAFLEHRDDPDYFKYNDAPSRKHGMSKPVLFVGGWFDLFGRNAELGYRLSVKDAPNEAVAKGHRLIMGPWNHSVGSEATYPDSSFEMRYITMEWIQQQMNGIPSDFFQNVPVAIYVMGENRWRAEQQWPLPDAQTRRFYLHSGGNANSVKGDGTLSETNPAADENPDSYLADPANPIFNMGGIALAGAQVDQSEVESRTDVLVFTSPAMEEDMEVTGEIHASFYAATSATDTDFFVRVVDVAPDGTALNVVTGGRRARYVKNGRSNPTAVGPGEVLKYEVVMRPTSYVFKKGHQLRVDICSSDIRFFDLNPNAFIDLNTATAKDYVVATQTVYHDADHPAVIELPVIPESHHREWIKWPFGAKELGGLDCLKDNMTPFNVNDPVMKSTKELPSTTPQTSSIGGELQEATNTAIRF